MEQILAKTFAINRTRKAQKDTFRNDDGRRRYKKNEYINK